MGALFAQLKQTQYICRNKVNENMITEDYVSFETAKLLKEKGFDWECIGYYVDDEPNDVKYSLLGETNSTWESRCCSAPTFQMTMKWLREEKEIVIVIKPYPNEDGFAYVYEIRRLIGRYDFFTRKVQPENNRAGFDTYEDAVEAAIKYCLKNLI